MWGLKGCVLNAEVENRSRSVFRVDSRNHYKSHEGRDV